MNLRCKSKVVRLIATGRNEKGIVLIAAIALVAILALAGTATVITTTTDMKISSKNFSLLCNYGMDVNGNPVTVGANACPFGWRLTWTLNNATQSKVIGYF